MNIFVLTSPFHFFVVRRIISQYYPNDENLIISTIKGERDYSGLRVVNVGHSLSGIIQAWKLKFFIIKHIETSSFFIPHLGTLFSSFLNELSIRYNRPINIYYEGIALFYDSVVPNLKAKRKRKLMGALMGIKYHHHEQLYPMELKQRASFCFTPKDICLDGYREVKIVSLKTKCEGNSKNILILTSNTATYEVAVEVCNLLPKYCKVHDGRAIYIKPHYELPDSMINCYIDQAESKKVGKVVLLDKYQPIEELYNTFSFGTIISQVYSSALINAQIIFGDELKIVIYDKKTIVHDVAEKMGMKYE